MNLSLIKPSRMTLDMSTHGLGLAAALALMLLAAGCGSSSTSSSTPSTAAPATTSKPTTTETSSSTSTSTSSSGTTPAGSNLALGSPAVVDYRPGIEASDPTYRLRVTVESIKKAPASDLNGVELEKAQQGQTPFYVTEKITNEGAGNASAEDGVPTAGLQATDDRGEQGQELTILGKFKPCESKEQPKQFTKGVTYETCVIYLVGGGGSIVSEKWTGSGDAYTEKPIVWKAG